MDRLSAATVILVPGSIDTRDHLVKVNSYGGMP